jgi:hypothetical protein
LSCPTLAGRPGNANWEIGAFAQAGPGKPGPYKAAGGIAVLLLLGYVILHDHRMFTRQHSATRVFFAIPILSLALFP